MHRGHRKNTGRDGLVSPPEVSQEVSDFNFAMCQKTASLAWPAQCVTYSHLRAVLHSVIRIAFSESETRFEHFLSIMSCTARRHLAIPPVGPFSIEDQRLGAGSYRPTMRAPTVVEADKLSE